MSEASEKALREAAAAVKSWVDFCSHQSTDNVQHEAMRRSVSELIKIRGEMQAIRILLDEQAGAPKA